MFRIETKHFLDARTGKVLAQTLAGVNVLFMGGKKKKESSLGIFSQIALSVVKRYDPPPPPVSYYTPVW